MNSWPGQGVIQAHISLATHVGIQRTHESRTVKAAVIASVKTRYRPRAGTSNGTWESPIEPWQDDTEAIRVPVPSHRGRSHGGFGLLSIKTSLRASAWKLVSSRSNCSGDSGCSSGGNGGDAADIAENRPRRANANGSEKLG